MTALTCLACNQKTRTEANGWVCTHCTAPTATAPIPIQRHPQTLTAATDNAVQKAGASAGIPKAGTNRRLVLDALIAAGSNGHTFEELGGVLGMEYSHVGPRVRELKRDGFVIDSGLTRLSSHQSEQSVWRAV